MKESELQALISLLEDDDPSIREHVEKKLVSLGEPVIPALEAAWQSESAGYVQERIEEVVHRIQAHHTLVAIQEWRNSKGQNLLEGWFLVTQFQFPELDFGKYRAATSRLIQLIWLEIRNGMSIRDKFRVINRMLFEREKFRANRSRRFDPNNYFLHGVFDTRKGSPLSLGFLYLVICEELDIPVSGIILPGYFVLHFEDERSEIFIDVYDKGAFFTRKDLEGFLKKKKVEQPERYYQPSSRTTMIITLIEALIYCYEKADKQDKASGFKILLQSLNEDQ